MAVNIINLSDMNELENNYVMKKRSVLGMFSEKELYYELF